MEGVNKTAAIVALAAKKQIFFLLRPPRFGRTHLVETLATLFADGAKARPMSVQGALWQDRTYPVALFRFSKLRDVVSAEDFKRRFEAMLIEGFSRAGFVFDEGSVLSLDSQLRQWLRVFPVKSLVVLADDWDVPMWATLDRSALQARVLGQMESLLALLKEVTGRVRFGLFTGAMRFRRACNFADGDFVDDITWKSEGAALLGWTQSEIEAGLGEWLEALQRARGLSREAQMDDLRRRCGGYVFNETGTPLFRPEAVTAFLNGSTEADWRCDAMDEALRRLFVSRGWKPMREATVFFSELREATSIDALRPEMALVQAGCLAVRSVTENGVCQLACPNEEAARRLTQLEVACQ